MSLTVAAMVLNLGKYFELQPTECIEQAGFRGIFTLGPIMKNRIYALYYNLIFFKIVIAGVIPTTLLIYLYTKIFIRIRKRKQHVVSHIIRAKEELVFHNG